MSEPTAQELRELAASERSLIPFFKECANDGQIRITELTALALERWADEIEFGMVRVLPVGGGASDCGRSSSTGTIGASGEPK
jgi:hypothetical protein